MAETSALCISPLALIPSISRSSSPSAFTSSHKSSISHSPRPSRPLRFSVKASSDSGNFFADDSLGFFSIFSVRMLLSPLRPFEFRRHRHLFRRQTLSLTHPHH
ncbi:hypothetical protein SO802_002852 [Lithocarpus litseifolius]|uniref:Uncharacterized protein n=1 Tax=Lithocarpus litseifolius TaxID=425828 RepID=A0AAW2DYP4_9ROSI